MNETLPLPSGSAGDHLGILARVAAETGALKPAEIVWQALLEAVEIVQKLPDQERRWQQAGRHSNWRGPSGTSYGDARQMERHRTLAGLLAGDPIQPIRTARNSEEALLCLEWLRWLHGHREGDRLENAVTLLLRGDHKQEAAMVFKPNRKYSRQTTYEIRTIATGLVLAGLRDRFGITFDATEEIQAA